MTISQPRGGLSSVNLDQQNFATLRLIKNSPFFSRLWFPVLCRIPLTLRATSAYLRKASSSRSSIISSSHASNPVCYVEMLRDEGYRFRGWNTVAEIVRVDKGLIATAQRQYIPRRMRRVRIRDSGRTSRKSAIQQSVHCLLPIASIVSRIRVPSPPSCIKQVHSKNHAPDHPHLRLNVLMIWRQSHTLITFDPR